jgi:hypothetical protein
MTFIPVELRAPAKLRCPYCQGTGLTVSRVDMVLPRDDLILRFNWEGGLRLFELAAGNGSDAPACVVLAVDCPRCGHANDQTYLQITDGETRVGDFAARLEWDTDADVSATGVPVDPADLPPPSRREGELTMAKLVDPDERPFTLLEGMRCPHCGGTDLSVRKIWANFPADRIIVALATKPLEVIDLDGGSNDQAWITLIVYCAGCDCEIDLYLRDGEIRVGDDRDTARAVWGNLI